MSIFLLWRAGSAGGYRAGPFRREKNRTLMSQFQGAGQEVGGAGNAVIAQCFVICGPDLLPRANCPVPASQ